MIAKDHEGERLLEIGNGHIGHPPTIDVGTMHVGYHEHTFGDQSIFIGDRTTGKATICSGILGWREIEISIGNTFPSELHLDPSEKIWIVANLTAINALTPHALKAKTLRRLLNEICDAMDLGM